MRIAPDAAGRAALEPVPRAARSGDNTVAMPPDRTCFAIDEACRGRRLNTICNSRTHPSSSAKRAARSARVSGIENGRRPPGLLAPNLAKGAMQFDLVDLSLFRHVADAGSITRGAERAHLALAAAS